EKERFAEARRRYMTRAQPISHGSSLQSERDDMLGPSDCVPGQDSVDHSANGLLTHPLFPRAPGSKGPETRDVRWIQNDRLDHMGRKERHPQRFSADELTSWEQIVDTWGGGTYQLAALDGTNQYVGWTAPNDKFFSPEACKPFRPQSAGGTTGQQPSQAAATPATVAPAPAQETPVQRASDPMLLVLQHALSEAAAARAETAAARAESSRMLFAFLERASKPAQASPAFVPADPIAQLTGLATVAEKLRPPDR